MDKDNLKSLLESYKYESQFYNQKDAELNKAKEQKLKDIERLKEVNKGLNQKLIDDAISKYTEEVIKSEKELSRLLIIMKQIEALVEVIEQPYRNVLYFKYINGLSIEEIAVKMNYSPQRIYQLHDIGIKKILTQQKEDA
jgi:DNA-directed RNA polymerase specialized sigma subunit